MHNIEVTYTNQNRTTTSLEHTPPPVAAIAAAVYDILAQDALFSYKY